MQKQAEYNDIFHIPLLWINNCQIPANTASSNLHLFPNYHINFLNCVAKYMLILKHLPDTI